MTFNLAAMVASMEAARLNRLRREKEESYVSPKKYNYASYSITETNKEESKDPTVSSTKETGHSGMDLSIESILHGACILFGVIGFIALFVLFICIPWQYLH